MRVLPAKKPRPEPSSAQASSSTTPAATRQRLLPRMPEIEPRQPYRRFPNEAEIQFVGENPARLGTPRHARLEQYKSAKTIGEYQQLGGTSGDISADIKPGVLSRVSQSASPQVSLDCVLQSERDDIDRPYRTW